MSAILARFAALLQTWHKNAVLDLINATETAGEYSIRAWSGAATDEGTGLISLVEISDGKGRLVCRFELLLHDAARLKLAARRGADLDVSRRLQDTALEKARDALTREVLPSLHGRRLEIG